MEGRTGSTGNVTQVRVCCEHHERGSGWGGLLITFSSRLVLLHVAAVALYHAMCSYSSWIMVGVVEKGGLESSGWEGVMVVGWVGSSGSRTCLTWVCHAC